MNEMEQRVAGILDAAVKNGEMTGAGALVLRGGREVCCVQAGLADLAGQVPVRRDTIFRLYSMTKPIAAYAILLLWERGEVDLLDPVSRYLPAFARQTVGDDRRENSQPMTIHHLLSMTSGLTYGGEGSENLRQTQELFEQISRRIPTERPMTTFEVADRLAAIPLAFVPGSHWCYGTSADVLGAIVEVVSGKSLRDYLREELFLPLGMTDTDFYVPAEKQSRLACTYQQTPEGLALYTDNGLGIPYDLNELPAFVSGGAGLVSTLDDYAKFAQMLMNGGEYGGRQYLCRKTADYFTHAGQTPALRRDMTDIFPWMCGYNYGNLMRNCEEPRQAAMLSNRGEYGWDGWLGCVFLNDPETKTTFLYMQQVLGAGLNPCALRVKNCVWHME
jgi:CubicO group peptidase (beta-lactamase class C family)